MTDRKVPLGISIITILMYIGAILDFAAGLFMVLDKASLADASSFTESAFLYQGIALIVSGIIIGLLAMGLRSGSNGIRVVIAVVMAIRLLFGIYVIFAVPIARYEGLATAIVAVVVLYFLYGSDDSKEFFA